MSDNNTDVVKSRLSWLPVAFFGSVMGLSGLSQAWKQAHILLHTPEWISSMIGVFAVLAFIGLTIGYSIKAITGFEYVKNEFNHPIAGALFGTPIISLLLLPLILADINLSIARTLWIIGVVSMAIFSWNMAVRWLVTPQKNIHATPAWIVPLVGLIDIPLAIPVLHFSFDPSPIAIMSLSVGLFFAVPIFTIVFSRLLFEDPMPANLKPTLLIMVAPFAVGFLAYLSVVENVDLFAEGLFSVMLFLLAVLLTCLKDLVHCCPFRISWWAVSFPLAAATSAVIKIQIYKQISGFEIGAWAMLILTTAIISYLFVRTLYGIFKGELSNLAI